jgi:hypothetical protein
MATMMRSSAPPAPGGVDVAVPAPYAARWLSDPEGREAVAGWTASSPESCLYNTPAYVRFAAAQNGRGDLLWLLRDGAPVLGIPLIATSDSRLSSGYGGLLFADGVGDGPLQRGVRALWELLRANRRLGFHVLQAVQAPGYEDPARMAEFARLLDERRLGGPSLYSRVVEVEAPDAPVGGPDVSGELLMETGMEPYEAELRNQIRQALRAGLHADCSLPASDAEIEAAYAEFIPLHRRSWTRTGMVPHPAAYWLALSRAVVDGGGRDMLVTVRDAGGEALATVSCHLRGRSALYWAGASSEAGLKRRANPLCLHAAIRACAQLGVRHFELGRFDARERDPKELSVTRYKRQFGGELVRVVGFQTAPPLAALVRGRARGVTRRLAEALGRSAQP